MSKKYYTTGVNPDMNPETDPNPITFKDIRGIAFTKREMPGLFKLLEERRDIAQRNYWNVMGMSLTGGPSNIKGDKIVDINTFKLYNDLKSIVGSCEPDLKKYILHYPPMRNNPIFKGITRSSRLTSDSQMSKIIHINRKTLGIWKRSPNTDTSSIRGSSIENIYGRINEYFSPVDLKKYSQQNSRFDYKKFKSDFYDKIMSIKLGRGQWNFNEYIKERGTTRPGRAVIMLRIIFEYYENDIINYLKYPSTQAALNPSQLRFPGDPIHSAIEWDSDYNCWRFKRTTGGRRGIISYESLEGLTRASLSALEDWGLDNVNSMDPHNLNNIFKYIHSHYGTKHRGKLLLPTVYDKLLSVFGNIPAQKANELVKKQLNQYLTRGTFFLKSTKQRGDYIGVYHKLVIKFEKDALRGMIISLSEDEIIKYLGIDKGLSSKELNSLKTLFKDFKGRHKRVELLVDTLHYMVFGYGKGITYFDLKDSALKAGFASLNLDQAGWIRKIAKMLDRGIKRKGRGRGLTMETAVDLVVPLTCSKGHDIYKVVADLRQEQGCSECINYKNEAITGVMIDILFGKTPIHSIKFNKIGENLGESNEILYFPGVKSMEIDFYVKIHLGEFFQYLIDNGIINKVPEAIKTQLDKEIVLVVESDGEFHRANGYGLLSQMGMEAGKAGESMYERYDAYSLNFRHKLYKLYSIGEVYDYIKGLGDRKLLRTFDRWAYQRRRDLYRNQEVAKAKVSKGYPHDAYMIRIPTWKLDNAERVEHIFREFGKKLGLSEKEFFNMLNLKDWKNYGWKGFADI